MLPPRVLSPCLCLIRFWSAVSGCVRCWIWGVSTNHLNFFWMLLCSIYTSMWFISLSRYLLFLYISVHLTHPQAPHVIHVQSLVPYLLRVSATAPQIGREQWAQAQLWRWRHSATVQTLISYTYSSDIVISCVSESTPRKVGPLGRKLCYIPLFS